MGVAVPSTGRARCREAMQPVHGFLASPRPERIDVMQTIAVATDFSPRSDRAIRRGVLCSRMSGARLSLLHVVDDDQPKYLVESACSHATVLLRELAHSLRDVDHVECDYRVVTGDAFDGIARTVSGLGSDLLIIGPHRRQLLRDVFVGTTAERAIRASPVPTLMANAVPTGPYRRVLIGVDLSACSAAALEGFARLTLVQPAAVTVVCLFDAPEVGLLARASASREAIDNHLKSQEGEVLRSLTQFLADLPVAPSRTMARFAEFGTARTLLKVAAESQADLLVVGTHGRSGLSKALLGSVAEAVLRDAEIDVLAIPPSTTPDPPLPR